MEKLIRDTYKDQPYVISSGSTGIGSNYVRVQIDSSTSIAYYDTGTLHYLKNATTSLGRSASIQISAEYGKFNNANVDYHVSGAAGSYSVGFGYIDATKKTANLSLFRSTINNLNLDTNAMLAEFNSQINFVLESFHKYMNGTLHIEVK